VLKSLEAQGVGTFEDKPGKGSSFASWRFDGAPRGTGIDDVVAPSGTTPLFQHYGTTSVENARYLVRQLGSVPGGVLLEGSAIGLGSIESLTYDAKFNAFVLDNRGVYFVKVPPHSIAVLCRAIAQDDRVGVSLVGARHIVYGAVPKASDVAGELMLADRFLGDLAFGARDWASGYKFALNYEPKQSQSSFSGTALFYFSGFEFGIVGNEIRVTSERFNDTLIPIIARRAEDGGALPDEMAIENGTLPVEYVMNLQHLASNISYYRRERIIDDTFSYGELAAFIRGLKTEGVNLIELADAIDGELNRR